MPLLSCTARNCVYNKEEYCSKGDILVDGRTAEKADETCCRSFTERKEGASNRKKQAVPVRALMWTVRHVTVYLTARNVAAQIKLPLQDLLHADATIPNVEVLQQNKSIR